MDSGYTSETKAVLLGSERVNRWSFGLRGAWGIKPWVGVTANLSPGGADGTSSGNKSLNTFGAIVGFDFDKLCRSVPIATTLA